MLYSIINEEIWIERFEMEYKTAVSLGITSALLAAAYGLARTGKNIYSGVKGTGKNFLKAQRAKTLAPGNMSELMQYHLKGGEITAQRLRELDKAIMSTAKGVETGEANITMLQTLLRERKLLEPAVQSSQGMLSKFLASAGDFASENPALTALGVAIPAAVYIAGPERNKDY